MPKKNIDVAVNSDGNKVYASGEVIEKAIADGELERAKKAQTQTTPTDRKTD